MLWSTVAPLKTPTQPYQKPIKKVLTPDSATGGLHMRVGLQLLTVGLLNVLDKNSYSWKTTSHANAITTQTNANGMGRLASPLL